MNVIKLFASHLLSFAFVVALPLQSAVPVLNEPRHHVKFENKYVRVIDASVPIGDATLFHTHSIDNVPIAISGGKLKTQLAGHFPTPEHRCHNLALKKIEEYGL